MTNDDPENLISKYKREIEFAARNKADTHPVIGYVPHFERIIEQIGEPAIEVAARFYATGDEITRKYAIEDIGVIGKPSLILVRKAMKDIEPAVRIQAVKELVRIGLPALRDLETALEDEEPEVRKQAIKRLGTLRESKPEIYARAFTDENLEVRIAALEALPQSEESVDLLTRAINDPDIKIRRRAIHVARKNIGLMALRPVILATENADGIVASEALIYLIDREFYDYWQDVSLSFFPDKHLNDAVEIILNDLIIRKSSHTAENFNAQNVTQIFEALIPQKPALRSRIFTKLSNIAYEHEGSPRQRAIAVARNLSPEEFAALVKSRSSRSPQAAAEIMRELGGSEATAFFTEAQSQTLAEYRAPLIDLEDMARQRWEELTLEAKRSSTASKWMSIAVFVIGSVIVIWAFVLLTLSDQPWQQLAAALAGVGSFLAMYSQRFWKEPVEQIQRFSAQQARLQVAFIGYMNRVAQIRLIFEDAYGKDKLTPETVAEYQQFLETATDKAWQQLLDSAPVTNIGAEESVSSPS